MVFGDGLCNDSINAQTLMSGCCGQIFTALTKTVVPKLGLPNWSQDKSEVSKGD